MAVTAVVLLALAATACQPDSSSPPPPARTAVPAATVRLTSLHDRHDPIDGRNRVRSLRSAPRSTGHPEQVVTGPFLGQAQARAHVLGFPCRRRMRPVAGSSARRPGPLGRPARLRRAVEQDGYGARRTHASLVCPPHADGATTRDHAGRVNDRPARPA
ncbi:hypothetical protein [Streptomyces sp. NPDC059165]|uniref:hypothetical protein n=1 Tax=Streptomyces sp. NPDC059165 TaxID=3346751 RepID=UPI003697CD1A